MRQIALALVLSTFLAGTANAQLVPPLNSKPEGYEKRARVPIARDIPFPGTVQLTVDATDVTRGIFRIRERVPVTAAGDLVLFYPKWVPGGFGLDTGWTFYTPYSSAKSTNGTIGALLAQGMAPLAAASLGVYVGVRAARRLEQELGTLGVVASDLPRAIAVEMAAIERS